MRTSTSPVVWLMRVTRVYDWRLILELSAGDFVCKGNKKMENGKTLGRAKNSIKQKKMMPFKVFSQLFIIFAAVSKKTGNARKGNEGLQGYASLH